MTNPFEILGIEETANDEEIRKAYLRQVRISPPEQDAQRFQNIRTAYESIVGKRERMAYQLFYMPKLSITPIISTLLTQRGEGKYPPVEQWQELFAERLKYLDYSQFLKGNRSDG